MDDGQEQDHYEERLKEVFNSFDTNGVGSLCREELSELCRSLQLDDATPTLFQTLLQDQDSDAARVKPFPLLFCVSRPFDAEISALLSALSQVSSDRYCFMRVLLMEMCEM